MFRIILCFIFSSFALAPLNVLSSNYLNTPPFSEDNEIFSDTTYTGNLLAKVTSSKKITLEGYILPPHINNLIKEQLILKDKGTYIVHYEITEVDGEITNKSINIQAYVNENSNSQEPVIQNSLDSNLVTEIKLNKSYMDIGLGIGPNYGLAGGKMVLGYNGNGLAIGVGNFDGFITNSIGIQIKASWFFANVSYGTYGVYKSETFGRKKSGLIEGIIVMTGGQIDILQNKIFLELGLGYAQGGETKDPFGKTIKKVETVTFGLGIGYRIGK